jgi:putative GTP pyrophosphokinase
VDEILRAFDSWVLDVGDVAPQVRDLLRQLLTDRGVVVHSVEARAKARSSLARKVATHTPPYASLRDVTDVLGARIITYFPDEVDVVGQVIEREFTVDLANSHDRRATIEPERFGYMSVHYVVTLSPAREALAEWKLLAGWPFEIQVRSLLQHAWAEIEHDLGFHTAVELPRDVRRRWSRVAALLETADTQVPFSARSARRMRLVPNGSFGPRARPRRRWRWVTRRDRVSMLVRRKAPSVYRSRPWIGRGKSR